MNEIDITPVDTIPHRVGGSRYFRIAVIRPEDRIAMRWEAQSNCRISASPSRAAILPLTWSTRSAGDQANGACRLPDRERLKTGTCAWKDPMDLNGLTLSRRGAGHTDLRGSDNSV